MHACMYALLDASGRWGPDDCLQGPDADGACLQLLAARRSYQNADHYKQSLSDATSKRLQQAEHEVAQSSAQLLQLQADLALTKSSHAATERQLQQTQRQHAALADELEQTAQSRHAAQRLLPCARHKSARGLTPICT